MAPAEPRQISVFLRGMLVGGFAVACFLGPAWLEAQIGVVDVKQVSETTAGSWRLVADLVGLVDLLSLFAHALLGPLGQWVTLFGLSLRASLRVFVC